MNVSANFSTSASALAFFLGPLAWIQPCPEVIALDEPAAIVSGNVPENTGTVPVKIPGNVNLSENLVV